MDFVTLNKSVINYLPRGKYHLLYTFQVTYSQLQLGENYRSYNNRQSHPNLRAAVADSVNGDSEADHGSADRWATRRRRGRSFSTTKSCPVILTTL